MWGVMYLTFQGAVTALAVGGFVVLMLRAKGDLQKMGLHPILAFVAFGGCFLAVFYYLGV